MWFTRISLRNPVFATMVMLAIVVLGLFSYQRLKVDQFPNIDFPVVVVTAKYPGASPEIVESEVSKKVEEAVNSIAGINALTSRSYENQSVVIIEFQLHIDGRKAADDVRGVGSVTLVGGTKREINIYLNPVAMEAFGVTADQVASAVRNENQDLPVG